MASQSRTCTVALIGNPNTGKSTLFSGLVGVHQHVGNYPGVTVEKKTGQIDLDGRRVEIVDLPGLYSLAARARDEMVVVDLLLGRRKEVAPVDAVVCIVDAGNLERNLYLVSQVLELELPTVLAVNMLDVAESRGIRIDLDRLERRLGIPVVADSSQPPHRPAEVEGGAGRSDSTERGRGGDGETGRQGDKETGDDSDSRFSLPSLPVSPSPPLPPLPAIPHISAARGLRGRSGSARRRTGRPAAALVGAAAVVGRRRLLAANVAGRRRRALGKPHRGRPSTAGRRRMPHARRRNFRSLRLGTRNPRRRRDPAQPAARPRQATGSIAC